MLFPGQQTYPSSTTFPGSPLGTTIVATPEPNATPPRVRLDINTDQSSLTLYRVAADGSRTLVRTYDGGPLLVSAGSTFLYDAEVPQGDPVTYAAGGVAADVSPAVAVDSGAVWLVHPTVPLWSVMVDVISVSDRQAPANRTLRYPLGRQYPIVASDGVRKADSFTLTLYTPDAASLTALKKTLSGLNALLLNVPRSFGWIDPTTEYISVGDLTRTNPGGGSVSDRFWSLPCSVVDRPAGGSQSFNTYAVSLSLYPTYADRKAAAATYGEAFDPE